METSAQVSGITDYGAYTHQVVSAELQIVHKAEALTVAFGDHQRRQQIARWCLDNRHELK